MSLQRHSARSECVEVYEPERAKRPAPSARSSCRLFQKYAIFFTGSLRRRPRKPFEEQISIPSSNSPWLEFFIFLILFKSYCCLSPVFFLTSLTADLMCPILKTSRARGWARLTPATCKVRILYLRTTHKQIQTTSGANMQLQGLLITTLLNFRMHGRPNFSFLHLSGDHAPGYPGRQLCCCCSSTL